MKVYRVFTYSVYIRIFIEVFMFTVLMLLSEIKYYIRNGGDDSFGHQEQSGGNKVKGNYASLSICCLLLVLPTLFLLLVFVSWRANRYELRIGNECRTRELYNGILKVPEINLRQRDQDDGIDQTNQPEICSHLLQNVKIARLYYLMYLVKRLILIVFVVFIPSSTLFFGIKI